MQLKTIASLFRILVAIRSNLSGNQNSEAHFSHWNDLVGDIHLSAIDTKENSTDALIIYND